MGVRVADTQVYTHVEHAVNLCAHVDASVVAFHLRAAECALLVKIRAGDIELCAVVATRE